MKREILQEIKRINEIMGVKSSAKILLEQPGVIADLIDKGRAIWKNISKSPDSYTNATKYTIGDINIPSQTYLRLKAFINNPYSTISNLTNSDAFSLGRILSQDVPAVETLYQSQFKKVMLDKKISEEDLLKLIFKEARDKHNGDLAGALRSIFAEKKTVNGVDVLDVTPSSELMAGMLYNKMLNRIQSVSTNTFTKEIVPAEGTIKNFVKNIEPAIIKAYREIYSSWFNFGKDKEWYTNKIKEIEARAQAKLGQRLGSGAVDPQAVNREIRELFNFIVARKLSAQDKTNDLIKLYITDNPKIPQDVKDELETFGYVKAIKERLGKDIVNTATAQFNEAVQRNIESIPIMGGVLRGIAKKANDKSYDFGNSLLEEFKKATKRFFWQATWSSPFTPAEALARSIALGRTATISERVLLYILMSNIFIPMVYQGIEGLLTNTEIQRLKEIVDAVKLACEKGVLVPCPEEDIKQLENYTREQFRQGMKEKMPYNHLLQSIKDRDLLGILGSVTWWDEIYTFGEEVIANYLFGDQTMLETFKKDLVKSSENINNHLRALGVNPDDEKQVQALMDSLNKTYKNNLESFNNSLRDASLSISDGDTKDLGDGKYSFDGETYKFKVTKPQTGEGIFEMLPE
jgi:hypothetical protein